jgi:tetratricopeptide (TPR) repeat protein
MTESKQAKSARRWIQRIVLAGLAFFLFVAVVLVIVLRKPAPVQASPIQARLELAAGEVTVDMGDGPSRAVSGTPLLANAKIATDKGARALVRLPDGSKLFLRGESSVTLATESVSLEKGEYFLDAPPTDRKPLVHQVGGTAVTGADAGMSIRRDGDDTTVYVARGMATVLGKGGRVEVKAGEQASVKGDQAPAVAAVAFWDDWTGGMADFNSGSGIPGAGSGSIYGVDVGAAAGSPARRLEIGRQAVRATVREGISETEVDQTFFNPGERAVEGWYWFTVPEDASVTGFALETNGVLVQGEFIEQKEAAAQYMVAKASGHSPAILEWVDARTYRARIYPVTAGGTRRVVLRYVQLSPSSDDKLTYVYPMGRGEPVRIGEFSLSVNLGEGGAKMKIATLADARVENDGKVVTMRRSGYTPRADFQLEASLSDKRAPLSVSRFDAGGESADYVMVRYTPDIDWKKLKEQHGDVVVVVDTSAAGDETARQLKTATAEAILRALSDDDRFVLIALDVRPTVLHPKDGLAPASEGEIAKALEALADHPSGGATDLSSLFDVSLARLHSATQPAVVYVGDGIATSGDLTGEQLVEQLRRAMGTSRARFFSVAVGTDAHFPLLSELSRAGGGVSLRVDEADQTTARALELTAAIKTPTMTDLELDLGAGLDEPFSSASGKVSKGQEVIVLARTHHDLPKKVKVRGRIGGEAFEKEYETERDKSVLNAFVPRLWASEYVRRLLGGAQGPDAERGRIVALGLEYGLMTPFTSVLALESENAYRQMGIPRKKSKLRGEELGLLDPETEMRIGSRLAAVPPPAVLPFACGKLDASRSNDEAPATQTSPVVAGGARQDPAGKPPVTEPEQGIAPAPSVTSRDDAPLEAKEEAQATATPNDQPVPATPPPPPTMGRGVAAAKPVEAPAPAKKVAARPGPQRLHGNFDKNGKDVDTTTANRLADGEKQKEKPGWQDVAVRTCSDGAARPLAQRALLWQKRIKTAGTSPSELLSRYDTALSACELADWRAERTFLEIMQRKVDSAAAATQVLSRFGARPEVQKFLAKLILRRSVDQGVVNAIERSLFGSSVDWNKVDIELSEIEDIGKRIDKLREFIAKAPDDPNGGMRLIKLMIKAGKKDDAVALGRRLRDQGFLTPNIARGIGDVLARAGLADEAVRTYSEIVEFDPDGIDSRRLLGDIYLAHAWYEPAYRQYRTITEQSKDDPLGWLRLGAAAAGAGRTDEALRLERKIANAQGTPGPADPRRWARLLSSARLARLIDGGAGKPGAPKPESVKRELKELQLFSGPGALTVVTWEDLNVNLALVTRADDKDTALGEATDGAKVGLAAVLLSTPDAERASYVARLRSTKEDHDVAFVRHDIVWNGKDFKVAVKKQKLPANSTESAL